MEWGKNISMCGNQSELSQWLAGEAGPLDGVTCQFLGQQVAHPPPRASRYESPSRIFLFSHYNKNCSTLKIDFFWILFMVCQFECLAGLDKKNINFKFFYFKIIKSSLQYIYIDTRIIFYIIKQGRNKINYQMVKLLLC